MGLQQSDIDAILASENEDIAAIGTNLSAATDAITAQKAAFDKFVADHPDVDISELQASNKSLHDTLATSLGSIVTSIGTITAGSGAPPAPAEAPPVAAAADTTNTGSDAGAGSDAGSTGTGDATGTPGT